MNAAAAEIEETTLASVGTKFDVNDHWKCDCGEEHGFGPWAAAHWYEGIVHTCSNCNTRRDFEDGEVLRVRYPESS